MNRSVKLSEFLDFYFTSNLCNCQYVELPVWLKFKTGPFKAQKWAADTACLQHGYRKIPLFHRELRVPHMSLREEVEVHLVLGIERGAWELRTWWDNRTVQSATYPPKEFHRVHFSTFPNRKDGEGCSFQFC
jgi:hypothetical protein